MKRHQLLVSSAEETPQSWLYVVYTIINAARKTNFPFHHHYLVPLLIIRALVAEQRV